MVNVKTIYFNLKYLPFKQAIKLPILISNKVYLLQTKGTVIIEGEVMTGKIRIGYGDVGIFDKKRSRSIWEVSGTVKFMGTANIGHGSKISVGKDGTMILGNNFRVSAETSFVCVKGIEIGDDCLFSWSSLIMDTDYHKILDENNRVLNEPSTIRIGKNVWVGCRCLILKKSIIPDNSVIAAGSTINQHLTGEHSIYGGNPIKVLKTNVNWDY